MTDRDRLIELLKKADDNASKKLIMDYDDAIADNADYLLANGVIVPPCKVRDRLYAIFNNKVVKGITKSLEIVIEENKISYIIGLRFFNGIIMYKAFTFGKNIFPTKEEAEAELRKRSGNK